MSQKDFYIAKIDKIAKESFNAEQKAIVKKIIEAADEKDLDAVWGLVSQRVKIGFTFDEAPEVNHQAVAVVKENEKLFINSPNATNAIEHKLIIGENYDALKNLLVTYVDNQGKGLIDVIYIDPPYNTEKSKEEGNDYKDEVEARKFIYRDKFTRDGWLNMMNERLKLAKKLLSDKGVIFISIDDTHQAYLKILCDEIFGEENAIDRGSLIWNNAGSTKGFTRIVKNHEYILCYGKNAELVKSRYGENYINDAVANIIDERLFIKRSHRNPICRIVFPKGLTIEGIEDLVIEKSIGDGTNRLDIIEGKIVFKNGFLSENVTLEGSFPYKDQMEKFLSGQKVSDTKGQKWLDVYFKNTGKPYYKTQRNSIILGSVLKDLPNSGSYDIEKLKLDFPNPKPVKLIDLLLRHFSQKNNNNIILDFFAGSGTTGQAVMELNEDDGGNRKFILVTNNESNIATNITRERLYRVINGKGSKGETIEWEYSKEKKSLTNNTVRVFDIKTENLTIADIEKAEKIKAEAEKDFKKLNEKYKTKDDLDIYTQLASLNPQKSEK
jgi:adenine-specific DNA-methyltransferase